LAYEVKVIQRSPAEEKVYPEEAGRQVGQLGRWDSRQYAKQAQAGRWAGRQVGRKAGGRISRQVEAERQTKRDEETVEWRMRSKGKERKEK
jgi:hypothetical protein